MRIHGSGLRSLRAAILLGLLLPAAASARPRLLPAPSDLQLRPGAFTIPETLTIAFVSGHAEDRFAATLLAQELAEWGHRRVGIAPGDRGDIVLGEGVSKSPAGEEAYELEVGVRQIAVRASGHAGLFYGVQTLRQLLRAGSVPCVRVSDRPALRWRGVLEDLTRGPVPTLAALERRVELLSQLKVNLYALYFENTLTYADHAAAARPEGSLTQDELRELCAYAARFHVTILPVQQSLGHMAPWLALERYRPLAAKPGSDVLSARSPGTRVLLGSLYTELAASSPGPWVHVGGDEVLDAGAANPAASDAAASQEYLEFVRDVHDLLAERGKRMMIWGDGLRSLGTRLAELPRDLTVASWSYEVRPDYTAWIAPFRDAGLPFLVCPGAWNWRRLFPDIASSFENIRTFTRQGRQAKAVGQITCTWGDGGDALFHLAWYPVTCGAAAAWQSADVDSAEIQRCFDWWLYRSEGTEAADAQLSIARVHGAVARATGLIAEPQFLWLDPFHPVNRGVLDRLETAAPEIAADQERALDELGRARRAARRNRDLLEHLEYAARRIDAMAQRVRFPARARALYQDALEAAKPGGDRKRCGAAVDALRDLCGSQLNRMLDSRDAFRTLWQRENRPAGLERILAQYDHDAELWLTWLDRFRIVRLAAATGRPLPAADEVGLAP